MLKEESLAHAGTLWNLSESWINEFHGLESAKPWRLRKARIEFHLIAI